MLARNSDNSIKFVSERPVDTVNHQNKARSRVWVALSSIPPYPRKLNATDVVKLRINSNVRTIGTFSSDNDMLNKIEKHAQNAQLTGIRKVLI